VTSSLLRKHRFGVRCLTDPYAALSSDDSVSPDVILLDIDLPQMDGIETCRQIRRHPRFHDVPVMFFSAGAKEQFIDRGFRAGAQDYLEKPFSEAELIARVRNLTRLARYEQSLRNAADEVRRKNDLLSRELEAARRMQWSLLPATLQLHPTVRCAVFYEPAAAVGGDLYDVSVGADGMVRLLVADVAGHGVFAALLAAFFKMGYQVYSDREPGPGAVLQSIHRELCRSLDSSDYVTAFAGWLDPATGVLRYASAGHVPGLLYRRGTHEVERLLPTGPMVGLMDESRFAEESVRLEPHDSVVLLTDGILEAEGPIGELYGLRRVEALARRFSDAVPQHFLQELRIELEDFYGASVPDDDLTALAVDWQAA
jgi:serine phosphatase RsbU (regulator of sigma subunit)